MQTTIRLAEPGDTAGIRFVGFATWPTTYGDVAGPEYVVENLDSLWSIQAIDDAIARDNIYVAEQGGKNCGITELGEYGDERVMWKLYVLPECQGQGVGGLLLEAVMDRVAAEGRSLITEYVAANTPAGGFYTSHGFTATTTPSGPLDSVWMRYDDQR